MHSAKFLILTATLSLMVMFSHGTKSDSATDRIKSELFDRLAVAETLEDGKKVESQMWELWFNESPNAEVRAALDAGRERISAYDYEAAENYLDQVVEAAPDYAEGYNQRAYARFLREKYSESQSDLEKTLELEPNHFGALSGMYHILRIQNRHPVALRMLQKAVMIHPWINERGALPKELWPEFYRKLNEPGQEI